MTSITFARWNVLLRTATLALCRQPLLRSARPDRPIRCKTAGWKLPAPLVSCSSAVSCDIHLLNMVRLVNLGLGWRVGVAWGGGGPAVGGDSASADHICPETCFQQHERSRRAVPLSSQPGGPFNSPHASLNQHSTSITPGLLLSFRVGR